MYLGPMADDVRARYPHCMLHRDGYRMIDQRAVHAQAGALRDAATFTEGRRG
jgi:hypothetical protein